MKWFNNPQTLEELKSQFKTLAKKHHPDRGGSNEAMAEINNEYEQLFAKLKNRHGATKQEQSSNVDDGFREIIEMIIHCEGLEIELCGVWIWVGGSTYAHKDALKNAGFHYASKKRKWYWSPESDEEDRPRRRSNWSMEKIRETYGSERYETKQSVKIG